MEFDLIDRIRRRVHARGDVALGIGDDAALLDVPSGRQLVVATDTLNAGVHFPLDTAPADIGWKALAVNLSDLAAMGAEPAWCTLSLSMPSADAVWLDAFIDGFAELAGLHRVALVGGDTTRGPLSICVNVHGFVEPGRALRRDAARASDDLWVSGTLGDAAAALALLLPLPSAGEGWGEGRANPGRLPESGHVADSPDDTTPHVRPIRSIHPESEFVEILPALRHRLDRPTPRIALGRALIDTAHACIDLSDGLLADLAHVANASRVRIEIDIDRLPLSDALAAQFDAETRRTLQAAGGDDYELAFTVSGAAREAVESLVQRLDLRLTRIGRVLEGEGVRALDAAGREWRPAHAGYQHFVSS